MEQLFSPNFNDRPQNSIINSIIIHYTEVNKAETIKIFQDKNKEVSSHYLIDKVGEVILFVDPDKRAWHAGVSCWKGVKNLNDNSIGIEIENDGKEEFTKAQYQSLIRVIVKLKEIYPTIKDELILGHSDIAPDRKIDPGEKFLWEELYKNNIGIYSNFYTKALEKTPKNHEIIAQMGDEGEKVKGCQILLSSFGYCIKIDGIYSKKTAKVVKAFKMHFCPKRINNIWDDYAFKMIRELMHNAPLN